MKMNEYIDLVNKKIDEFMPICYPQKIFKSMKYTVTLPGKRLRPVMCLETCRMFGGNIEDAIPTACAIEMLHSQTLIHDDLPCMDNDDMRRGRPSCHKAFGYDTALLAGDALLTHAFLAAASTVDIPPERVSRAISVLAQKAGIYGMVGGQVMDLDFEKNGANGGELTAMYIKKTSCLLECRACGS